MPIGLGNARAMVQHLRDRIFCEDIVKEVAAYLDELLMYALQLPQIHPAFDRTLGQVIEAGLKCKPTKFQIFPESIRYFGHSSKGKTAWDHCKLKKIRGWQVPTTGIQIASFLGLCNYYGR